jgi:glycine/D-amino acid oxidase-like deaminating enzyme
MHQGGTVITDEIRAIEIRSHGVIAATASGAVIRSNVALVAAGAFSNCHSLFPRPLWLRIKSESTIVANVSRVEQALLQDMPALNCGSTSRELSGIYVTPPMAAPGGGAQLKLGGNTSEDKELRTLVDMQTWMREGPGAETARRMFTTLKAIVPQLTAMTYRPKPCLVAYTPHGNAYIDQIDERLFVATGGNGASAQTSDTLGWLAAELVLQNAWVEPFRREAFRAVYA